MRIQTIMTPMFIVMIASIFCATAFGATVEDANIETGEALYRQLVEWTTKGTTEKIEELNTYPRTLNWQLAEPSRFKGHLRFLSAIEASDTPDRSRVVFARKTDGDVFIINIPDHADPMYQNLETLIESKLNFHLKVLSADLNGNTYQFARFIESPKQPLLDKLFKQLIIIMLFLIMVGMGLTLTGRDFAVLVKKPKGIIIGEVLQFGVMPLVAFILGHLMGFYKDYPYIFVGMIMITATPGGVTSNLMTHYAKGDVALSVSLTSISTVLSLLFVPLLLGVYCANIPDVKVPTDTIALTIVVLVIIPLIIGMIVRKLKEALAKRLIPLFSALGIIALLFLIIAGILSNLEGFANTERHGVRFYSMVLSLTVLGVILGAIIPKIIGVVNYQARAVSLETGLRNASLAMTLSLLIQDSMGDFHSSMFWVAGMFGLSMYVVGIIAIKVYPKVLPVK